MSHSVQANQLQTVLQDKLGPVEQVYLHPTAGERLFAIILLGETDVDRAATARIALSWALTSGLAVSPLVYRANEWRALDLRFNGRGWVVELSANAPGLAEQVASEAAYPAPLRRFLLREISHYRAFVQQIQRSSELPVHLALALSAPLAREAFALLFSLDGRLFSTDAAGFNFFVENHVSRGHFDSSHFQLLARLEGMAAQAKLHARVVGERQAEESFGWASLVGELRSFLDRFETFIRVAYTSEKEAKRNRRLSSAVVVLLGAVLAGGVASYLVMTSQAEPQANAVVLKKRAGGIVGEYYQGQKFEKLVATRVDRNINIATHDKIHPKLSKDNASVRWKGFLYFPKAGSESLCVTSDDGARLIFNKKQIAGEWSVHGERKSCATVYVKEGWYPLQLDFFEKGGRALVKLLRGKDEDSARSIPSSHFCCKDDKALEGKAPKAATPAIKPHRSPRRGMPEMMRAPANKPGKNSVHPATPKPTPASPTKRPVSPKKTK